LAVQKEGRSCGGTGEEGENRTAEQRFAEGSTIPPDWVHKQKRCQGVLPVASETEHSLGVEKRDFQMETRGNGHSKK